LSQALSTRIFGEWRKSAPTGHAQMNEFLAEAELRYGDADFQILKPGKFVRCAVTGAPIPLDALRYWNVDRQEAYKDAQTAFDRWKALNHA